MKKLIKIFGFAIAALFSVIIYIGLQGGSKRDFTCRGEIMQTNVPDRLFASITKNNLMSEIISVSFFEKNNEGSADLLLESGQFQVAGNTRFISSGITEIINFLDYDYNFVGGYVAGSKEITVKFGSNVTFTGNCELVK